VCSSDLNSLRLDGDSTFTLNIHTVQILGTHRTCVNNTGELQHTVGQGRFTVVNVSDYAKIPDEIRVGLTRL
jgi:hypothetical protein